MAYSVLLIDDSAILRRIATNVLGAAAQHCEVVTATRATEGFARACATPPSLILLDAHLAGTPRAELCERLLGDPRTARIPIVLFLGRAFPLPAAGELPDNIVEVLAKPFTPEQLLACVKSIQRLFKPGVTFGEIRQQIRGNQEKAVLVDRQSATAVVAGPKIPERSAAAPGGLRADFLRLAAEKANGVLAVTVSGQHQLDVYLEAGSVVVVTTAHIAEYTSGAADVLPAKVSPATLEAAAIEQRATGVPFLLTLGARGLLSKAAAVDLLHQFGQRFFARLWQMRAGTIRSEFTRLDAMPGFALRLEPYRGSADAWLLGTLRCVSLEDIAATARHEGFVGTPYLLPTGRAAIQSLSLNDEEREFSGRVDGKMDLPGIAKTLGCTGETAYLLLHRFRALGIMDYRPAPRAFVVTPRTSVRRVLPLHR